MAPLRVVVPVVFVIEPVPLIIPDNANGKDALGAVVSVFEPRAIATPKFPFAPLVLNVVAAFMLTVAGATVILLGIVTMPDAALKLAEYEPEPGQAVVSPLEVLVPQGVPVVHAPE